MSTTGPRLLVCLAALACLNLTACQSDSTDTALDDTTGAPSASSSNTTSTSPGPGLSETEPVAFAEALWEAFFGAADLPRAQWWAQLEPLLSPAAARVHKYTDPATFRPVSVTGDFAEAPTPPDRPGVTSEVYVPTSEGRYSLFLIRPNETAPWRLEGIGFPEGAQK